jgi:hypothetical protein
MNIIEFVSKLNRHQLYVVKRRAEKRIEEIEQEQKKLVWAVEDRYVCFAYFSDEHYLEAAEALLSLARKRAKEGCPALDRELRLRPYFFPESDYPDNVK